MMTMESSMSRTSAAGSASPSRPSSGVPSSTGGRRPSLESENRSIAKTSEWTIEENKKLLLALKQEQKELKQELANRTTAAVRDSNKGIAVKTAEKLEKAVHLLRRQYDKIMGEKKTALARLSNLQDTMRDLSKASGMDPALSSGPSPAASVSGRSGSGSLADSRESRLMANRLDKAMLKANEAQSIRKTYEQVLEKLKAEQAQCDTQAQLVENALKAASTEHSRLLVAIKEAQHGKEQAKQELDAFEEQLKADRRQRERHLEELRGQAQVLQQTNERLLQRQYAPKGGAGGGDADDAAGGPGGGDPAEAIRQLCSSSGVASVPELVSAMLAQQESHRNLLDMRAAAKEQVEELELEMAAAKSQLEDVLGGGKLTTQSQLDAAQAELREATAKADEARQHHDQVLRVHADVCQGLEHLATLVSALPAPEGVPPLMAPGSLSDPEQVLEVLAQCEGRLLAAHKFIQGFPKAAQLLDDMSKNPDLTFSTASAILEEAS